MEILATQKVVTPSGRQAQLKTVDVRTIVTGLDWTTNAPGKPPEYEPVTETFELGPVMDVVPLVSADGYMIQMTVIPSVKEFVGYDLDSARLFDNWDYVKPPAASPPSQLDVIPQRSRLAAAGGLPPVRQPTPLPIFRVRQVTTSCIVWDGQTVVLGGLISDEVTKIKDKVPIIGDLPFVGKFFRSESSQTRKKNLIIFVTPTIIDPAGNRAHRDEDLPFYQSAPTGK